jgi:hypothetical protein
MALHALWLVAKICALSALLLSAETIAVRSHYRDDGIFSWAVSKWRLRSRPLIMGLPQVDILFSRPGVVMLNVLRMAGALMLVAGPETRAVLWSGCAVIAATSHILTARGTDGRNGADQMVCIVYTAITIGLISPGPLAPAVVLAFLTGQLLLAYVTSGALKARERGWWDGNYLLFVLRTRSYGHRGAWAVCRRWPSLSAVASALVVILECSFPLTLVLPSPLREWVLAGGLTFHVANAIVIGLNSFTFTYVGLYPALLFVASLLHR